MTTLTAEKSGTVLPKARATTTRRPAVRRVSATTIYHVLMIVASLIWLIPALWMLSLALTPNEMLKTSTDQLIPPAITWQNFIDVFRVGLTPRWFLNSIVVSVVT